MTVLVLGASGATGKLLVQQLLSCGESVKAIVRSKGRLNIDHKNLSLIEADVHDLSSTDIAKHLVGCTVLASCLGHNLTFKGMFGHPRMLVFDTLRKVCNAIDSLPEETSTKIVLMNTTGKSNRDIPEKVSFGQACVISLLRLLLPPHLDNENAADYLRAVIGQQHKKIGWVIVRPDGLIDENEVSEYSLHPSPTRSAIFDAGQTSRINVAHFMAQLVVDEQLWQQWRGQMPVIYNAAAVNDITEQALKG